MLSKVIRIEYTNNSLNFWETCSFCSFCSVIFYWCENNIFFLLKRYCINNNMYMNINYFQKVIQSYPPLSKWITFFLKKLLVFAHFSLRNSVIQNEQVLLGAKKKQNNNYDIVTTIIIKKNEQVVLFFRLSICYPFFFFSKIYDFQKWSKNVKKRFFFLQKNEI